MKRISFIAAAAAAFCLGGIAGPPLGGSEARAAELVSVNGAGTDSGNGLSGFFPIISADGTKVAFTSRASDLGPTDTPRSVIDIVNSDVYVRDLSTGTTTLVSVNFAGTDSGDGFSGFPAISADGTKVAFLSNASNLGPTDTNGLTDVYVRDLTAGTTTLVSVNDLGSDSGNGANIIRPVISADGAKVAFRSRASDLVLTDNNNTTDVFVRDLTMGTTTLVSVNGAGTDSGNRDSAIHVFSADGTKVAFQSAASDLVPTDTNGLGTNDVFVRDLTMGTTTLVSVNGAGTDSGNGVSLGPIISADGTKVAFFSRASDLGPTDTDDTVDVYVRDLTAGTTTLVSVNDLGTDSGNGFSSARDISADGTKVAFSSRASDLVPTDTNGAQDVYVRDLSTGTTTLVSVNDLGTDSGNGASFSLVISADGTKVAFESVASDLGPTDTNSTIDVFVRDLSTGTTTLVSVNDLGMDSGNGDSFSPVISADGTKVAFDSDASDLGPTDTNGTFDVFVALVAEPAELIANLVADVIDLNLAKGISNSLDAKLDAVEKALDDANANNDVAAINVLEAFKNAVEAQRGEKLTNAEADALIAAAQQIIDLLIG